MNEMSLPPDRPALGAAFIGYAERIGSDRIAGYAYDPADPLARVVVELLIDGVPVALARAETFLDAVHRMGIGDGCAGFTFVLSEDTLAGSAHAQVIVANHGGTLGPPMALHGPTPTQDGSGPGQVRWFGGVQLAGWLAPGKTREPPWVRAWLDGEVIAEAPADRWSHLDQVGGAQPVPGFNLHLPDRLADGRTKRIVVTNASGEALSGSPLTLVAFPDPLEAIVARAFGAERETSAARARLFDALLPNSRPLTDLARWLDEFPSAPVLPNTRSLVVVILGEDQDQISRTLASLDEQAGCQWVAGALPSPDGIGFEPDDLAGFLTDEADAAGGVFLIPAGAVLRANTLARFAETLATDPQVPLVYGDIAIGEPGHETALMFPAFDYERWIEQGYGALAFALPIRRAREALAVGADSLYRLANAQFGPGAKRNAVVHLPGITALLPALDLPAAERRLARATEHHLGAGGMAASVRPAGGTILPAVRVSRALPSGRVSLIIPTRDRVDLLGPCLASIEAARARHAAELIVVDNNSSDPATLRLFDSLRRGGARILSNPGSFNYARLCNAGARIAAGDYLCFLNNDVEAVSTDWLDELLSRIADPGTAAVGAVLRWPSQVIQHAGVVLGPRFSASHAFDDRLAGDPGYGDLLRVASQPSAVTGACLLVRRGDYRAVEGMDEVHFPVNFNDVDLCLKLGALGRGVVLTPHLHMIHRASASRGKDQRPDQVGRYRRELAALRARWGDVLESDPAYSPHLALSDNPYTALACPPRSFAARHRIVAQPRAIPTGL